VNTSFSALDTFRTCPLKYKLQEIDKIKTPKSPEAVFGTLVHSTLKFIHDGSFLLPTQKQALNFFTSNWNSEVFSDEVQERMAFARGIKIIQDYFKKNDPSKIDIVLLESRFSVELEGEQGEKHLISGFIDRIDKTDDGFEIIDYKTSRKLPSQEMVDDNLQLSIYLLALLKRYPHLEKQLEKIKLSLYFLQHSQKLSTTTDEKKLELQKDEINGIIEEIKKSDFPAVISPLCDWCGFQKICPMWKHKFLKTQNSTLNTQKDSILEEYIHLSEKIKQDKKRIAELGESVFQIMEQEKADRLFSEGKVIAKSSRKTYKYNEEALSKILKNLGKWEQAVKIDNLRLKRVLETLPFSAKEEIEKNKEEKESFSLTIKKDKGEIR
jgi:putative RecB family exonuclease